MYGVEPGTGLAVLLDRMARPYDAARVAVGLLGLTHRTARKLVGTVLATSREAEALLAAMPAIVRSLAIATTDQPERCVGEIRGPVLWGETMSARSASAGDPGLYICATTTKAYDTDENRVLKAALAAVHRAAKQAEHGTDGTGEGLTRRARHNGHLAGHLLEHQTLAQVPVVRPNGRMLRRTRAGSRRHTYQPALEVLRRAGAPLGPEHLRALSDERTTAQHDLLAATLAHVEAVAGPLPPLRTDHGGLATGPIRYHHPGFHDRDHVDGITIGDVLLDVPGPLESTGHEVPSPLQERAEPRHAVLARSEADVAEAVRRGLGPRA